MPTINTYQNLLGEDCVLVVNDDGTTWSGTKADYEASTLPSESSIPTTPQAGA